MSNNSTPSYVRVQRVSTILAEDKMLSGKLSGKTTPVTRRDGHSQEFPVESIELAQKIHADGKDVAHIGRSEILDYARKLYGVEAPVKESVKSISDNNSSTVRSGVATLVSHAITIEKAVDPKSPRIQTLEKVLAATGGNLSDVKLLPAYSVVMSAISLAEVDKALFDSLGSEFDSLRKSYQSVVVM
jgi:hypothetical protein